MFSGEKVASSKDPLSEHLHNCVIFERDRDYNSKRPIVFPIPSDNEPKCEISIGKRESQKIDQPLW